MNRRLALRIAARALVTWSLACVLVYFLQRPLANALLLFFEVTIRFLQQEFAASLQLADEGGHAVIRMIPFLRQSVPLTDELALRPYVDLQPITVSVDHALVPLVLLVAGVASWPFSGKRQALVRTLLAVVVLPLVLVLGTPVLLAGRLQMAVLEAALQQGTRLPEPALLSLMIFMESGGRWLLPLALAIACVALSDRICSKPDAEPPISLEHRSSVASVGESVFPPV